MTVFDELLKEINNLERFSFDEASIRLIEWIDNAPDLLCLIDGIGSIPESIPHDSTAEKLFSKASDAVLSKGFRTLGLKSVVVKERSDSADVQAESIVHGYTLAADAKAFRLSRTARNQKDYKVTALSGWRRDLDYAVLCAPYFQYPNQMSQIYQQSTTENVSLFSWEYLAILVKKGIKETPEIDLSTIWNYPSIHAHEISAADLKKCYLKEQDKYFSHYFGISDNDFSGYMDGRIEQLRRRGEVEISYWKECEAEIRNYTREKAVEELIKARKIQQKIDTIDRYVSGLSYD